MENSVTNPMHREKQHKKQLPYSLPVFILGIASISCIWSGLGGLIVGIIAMVQYNKAKDGYGEDFGSYHPGSIKRLEVGRTLALIGVIGSALVLLATIAIAVLIFVNI